MKKLLLVFIASVFVLPTFARNGERIITKLVENYKAQNGISANYVITTDQGNTTGQIVMQGNKFRMSSADLICWYDGKTQWSYSTMTDEVCITEPTDEELQMVNPYSIISNFRHSFNAFLMKSDTESTHEVLMKPKTPKSTDIASVTIWVSKQKYLPMKILFKMNDNTSIVIVMSNYKCKQSFKPSTFTYDKSLVPEGTKVVDLR